MPLSDVFKVICAIEIPGMLSTFDLRCTYYILIKIQRKKTVGLYSLVN